MGIVLFTLSSAGCAGDRIEYDPPDSNMVGKTIHFNKPMAYLLLSKKDMKDFDKETVNIGRLIVFQWDLENQFSLYHNYKREYFMDGMAFIIVGSYWVHGDWLTRQFAPNLHMIILKDENGIKSVCSMTKIDSSITDFQGIK